MATTKPIEVRRHEAEGMRIITVVPEEATKTAAFENAAAVVIVKAVGSTVAEAAPVPVEVVVSKAEEVAAVVIAVSLKAGEAGAVSKMATPKDGQAGVIANKVGSKAGQVAVIPIKVAHKAGGPTVITKPSLQNQERAPLTTAAGPAANAR